MVPERLEQTRNLLDRPLLKLLGQYRCLLFRGEAGRSANFRGEAGGSAADDEPRPVVRPARLSSARERRRDSSELDTKENSNKPNWVGTRGFSEL